MGGQIWPPGAETLIWGVEVFSVAYMIWLLTTMKECLVKDT